MNKEANSRMVLPVMYKINGAMIPGGMPMQDRSAFIRGYGIPADAARALAVQDRASGMLMALSTLIEQSGNAELIRKTNNIVTKWNAECDEIFAPGT